MRTEGRRATRFPAAGALALAALLALGAAGPSDVRADDDFARTQLKVMSDYLAAQQSFSFDYDINQEVVTAEGQKLLIASSGSATIERPDKIRVARFGGFADAELLFDGKTLTLLGKTSNLYSQFAFAGTLDALVDELRDRGRPLPGADLLLSNVYETLIDGVTDAKDLGSGVIGGVECDHLAYRAAEVDWQIWIAHGERPYPCRYIITSKQVAGAPQYSVQISNWQTGDGVTADDFVFSNTTNAAKVELKDLVDAADLPDIFVTGAN